MHDLYSPDGLLEIRLAVGQQMHAFVLRDVVVAFYDGDKAGREVAGLGCLINKLVHSFCGRMTHVELAFRFECKEIGREAWFACSVYQGHALQFKTKQYDAMWEVIDLHLKDVDKERLLNFCREDAQLELSFNGWFFLNFLTPACSLKTESLPLSRKTWCSEHVASRLADVGYDFGCSASRVTPTQIYQMLKERGYMQYRHGRTTGV